MLIDIHTHLQSSRFDDDRDAVIGRFRALGMTIVNIGTDRKSAEAAVALAKEHPDMYATVGQHPTDTGEQFNHATY
ncbi:MAG: TatD family hydrolase, partial [Candidatus Liptonbacteria bacterium]|nr:TatD family hydrolase [Candidatus Liptonbacteria bacterium]